MLVMFPPPYQRVRCPCPLLREGSSIIARPEPPLFQGRCVRSIYRSSTIRCGLLDDLVSLGGARVLLSEPFPNLRQAEFGLVPQPGNRFVEGDARYDLLGTYDEVSVARDLLLRLSFGLVE